MKFATLACCLYLILVILPWKEYNIYIVFRIARGPIHYTLPYSNTLHCRFLAVSCNSRHLGPWYKCTVPTTWQGSTSDKCPNTPVAGTRLSITYEGTSFKSWPHCLCFACIFSLCSPECRLKIGHACVFEIITCNSSSYVIQCCKFLM